MASPADLRSALTRDPPVSSRELCRRLGGIDRATLLRWVRRLDPEVLRLGKARRSAYALRRPLHGRQTPIPLYRIDETGNRHLLGRLSLIEPESSALEWVEPCPWPLDDRMADGWFEGLPYPLYDMAPQGFLGRHFAHRHARLLDVSERLADWTMLPMQYAPMRSGELPRVPFQPALPLPGDQSAWLQAREAAIIFWSRCAAEPRISDAFRKIAADNRVALIRFESAARASQMVGSETGETHYA
ncbi:hypothetical protein U5801_12355 [Lamprobacter modestohalophilus]|uniref:hypothetical protein n=1 Tax=Lamprobacter modestohalophilus TaxID=1064514 RepID=UPI002ADEB2F2|nr:hypothetical protein [Lamprobacter modestohalophilus]MEA1050593.1 hypothetical protein [Lamprobacter modestohalophilus]